MKIILDVSDQATGDALNLAFNKSRDASPSSIGKKQKVTFNGRRYQVTLNKDSITVKEVAS